MRRDFPPWVVFIGLLLLAGGAMAMAKENEQQQQHPLTIAKYMSEQFDHAHRFLARGREVALKHNLMSDGSKCLLCGIVVNEIEGFTAENRTEEEIEKIIQSDICAHLGDIKTVCDDLTDLIPEIMKEFDSKNSVSTICIEKGYCDEPFYQGPDPMDVPVYKINLDLPPEKRWVDICSNKTYQAGMGAVLAGLRDIFPGNGDTLSDLGKLINEVYFPADFGAEIKGCADVLGVDWGWLTLFNIGYEATDACTSIIAQTYENKTLHVRNMDFWDGIWLTNHLKNLTIQVEYQSKNTTIFHATTFAGYAGVLSGMRPGAFSISLNTRDYPNGIGQLFYEIIAALTEKNSTLVSFLTRHTLSRVTNFNDAIASLSNGTLIADVYYIVGGVKLNEGAVVTRGRENVADLWRLSVPERWYEVQTNYDHWKKPPWFDDRVDPANTAMNEMGRANLTLDNLLYKVLSVKPVLNLQSTFSMLACAADNIYKSYTRNCPYPCAE